MSGTGSHHSKQWNDSNGEGKKKFVCKLGGKVGKWTKIFSQDTIGGLFKVERSIGSHPNVILNFSLMKRLSVRILTIQKPPYSPDWTSWSSSEERGESFTSRSSILNWVAVTSGYKLLTLLKQTPLRDLSQSGLITRLMV